MSVLHLTDVLGRQQGSQPSDDDCFCPIICAIVCSVVVVVLCVAAIYYVNHKRKTYHVSKAGKTSSQDAASKRESLTLQPVTEESLKGAHDNQVENEG